MTSSVAAITIRECEPSDEAAVISLLAASLGWVPDDLSARFFRWKHEENPAGRSRAWVAVDGDRIIGFRTFLRWRFVCDGGQVQAVRAVDTATHPDAQGRGVFTKLTLHALEAFQQEGVAFVFNTPNTKSRPGYLKMGWEVVQRVPVLFRPRGPGSLISIARSRVPADKWSQPTTAGVSATETFADREATERLLSSLRPSAGLATHRTADHLAWRYGFEPLAYRALLAGPRVEDGVVVFRVRRRGVATEASICEVLLPESDVRRAGALVKQVLRTTGASYAIRMGGAHVRRAGMLPLPRQGPVLTWRAVCNPTMPPAHDWSLALGDVELF